MRALFSLDQTAQTLERHEIATRRITEQPETILISLIRHGGETTHRISIQCLMGEFDVLNSSHPADRGQGKASADDGKAGSAETIMSLEARVDWNIITTATATTMAKVDKHSGGRFCSMPA